jgi:hypothetical protein
MTRVFLWPLLVLGLGPALTSAQGPEVRGRIIDADSKPVADQAVLLHRVVGSTGANIAQAQSDSAGRFVIPVDTAGQAGAVYFLAARWRDELYISEPFQPPLTGTERMLQVGVPGTSATAMLQGTTAAMPGSSQPAGAGTAPASTPTSWLFFFAPLVVLAGSVLYFVLRNRPNVPERRRLLAQIAELDLQQTDSGSEGYRTRRAELLARVRELTGS